MELSSLLTSYTTEGIGALLIVLTLIQIAPIKINPWTYIAKKIGRSINGEVLDEVTKVSANLSALKKEFDEYRADVSRNHILRFNDDILHDVKHSKEHFDQILKDVNDYEIYCDVHKDYKNNVANLAIQNIKQAYKKCSEDNSFL